MDINPTLKYAVGITLATKVVPAVVDSVVNTGVDILQEAVQTPINIAGDVVKEALGQIVDIKI